jgi:SAM-dependent methyltransferase
MKAPTQRPAAPLAPDSALGRTLRYFAAFVREGLGRGEYTDLAPDRGSAEDVERQLSGAWKDPGIPLRQRALVTRQLASYRVGHPNPIFDALVEILRANVPALDERAVLEVGCSSGYYADVLAIRGIRARYHGSDYSEAFIRLARRLHPAAGFDVQDAMALGYSSGSFDVVVSGACIYHLVDHDRHVAEVARVARQWVVFHRTPIIHARDSVTYAKTAYGVQMIETHFNEQRLLRLLAAHSLLVADATTLSVVPQPRHGDFLAWKTYLCVKV